MHVLFLINLLWILKTIFNTKTKLKKRLEINPTAFLLT